MSKQVEAMKLALKALENTYALRDDVIDAKEALQEALAEQPAQQEPVAWGNLANWCLDSDRVLITDKDEAAKYHKDIYDLTPLYTSPQAQPAREPIKWADHELDGRRYKTMEERLKDAFYEGFTSSATYNDIELNDVDEEWLKYAAANGINAKGNT